MWDAETRSLIHTYSGGHISTVTEIAISQDGEKMASGGWDNKVILWNVKTGEIIRKFIEHTNYVWSVAMSVDAKRIVSGSSDNTIRIWNGETGE